MRRWIPLVVAAHVAAAADLVARPAAADKTVVTASGAALFGAFGHRAMAAFDLGLDLAWPGGALGLGGRLRLVAGEGVRGRDWDEASELLSLVRYATHRWAPDPQAPAVATAFGPLADVRLGHGAVVAGFTSGLAVDHRRSGLHVRAAAPEGSVEAFVDDVAELRVVGARVGVVPAGGREVGVTAALDREAPDGPTPDADGDGRPDPGTGGGADPLGIVALDGEWRKELGRRWVGALTADVVHVVGIALGGHAGARIALLCDDRLETAALSLELSAGSRGYLPGWFSPLYDVSRARFGLERDASGATQLSAAKAGDFGGVGARTTLDLRRPGLGEATVSYATRGAARDLASVRVAAPWSRSAQVGAWLAFETRAAGERGPFFAGAAALEARVRLPARLFAALELARLYRDDREARLVPFWLASVGLGAVLGE